ncbi:MULTISPECIES: late competence development ComFB family protein [unclassified Pseudodesulfovibrio]|uniref:late competence development ComFB family protein n=1 Tax=unclassified Pseudodesulfovibrio TaxID=2661612 RepID=UPI000FEBAC78|nr:MULTISPECIES: late competence development ComFB family protein [unclassified Pseudodesulfovibrio]MCJ2166087.1 late competence development ComFB family protein [Pseudodesulfovibrio sp. S3-i]RWU02439.1 competence protein ComFB [Pseudodesulfovibrio sp. S3]
MAKKTFEINGVDVSKITNRNESRVAKLIPNILEEYYADYIFEDLDIQDIYALTLNLIPAGYAQAGSIVLSNRISDYEINKEIRVAVERVLDNPTRSDI